MGWKIEENCIAAKRLEHVEAKAAIALAAAEDVAEDVVALDDSTAGGGSNAAASLSYVGTHAPECRCVSSESLLQPNEQTKVPFRASNIEKHDNEVASTLADAANSSQHVVNRGRACAALSRCGYAGCEECYPSGDPLRGKRSRRRGR